MKEKYQFYGLLQLELFDRAATNFIHHTIESHTALPTLFPPHKLKWEYLSAKVK